MLIAGTAFFCYKIFARTKTILSLIINFQKEATVEYIYVESNLRDNEPNFSAASLNLSKNVLISLIYGFQQKNFGFDTIKSLASKLSVYKEQLDKDIKIYIDSGGYSVIKGDVKFNDTQKLIGSYNRFLQYENDLFDYIFTLDIPLWGNDQVNTTRDNLYRFNYESIKQTLSILKDQPHLRDKLYFVWQFANPYQFEVWNQICSELKINQHFINRAIGGLVGIRERSMKDKSTRLALSPFTSMAFKCFFDYLNSPFTDSLFRLHILGTSHKVDRFQLLLLEKLFSFYCQDKEYPEPTVTYDTINYFRSAMFAMNNLQPYRLKNQQLIKYKNILEVEDDVIQQIYHTQALYDAYQEGKNIFKQLDPSQRQKNPDFLAPLNIFSNLNLDRYLNFLIEKYSVLNNILEIENQTTYLKQRNWTCKYLSEDEGKIFNNNDIKQINYNLEELYLLWTWLNNSPDEKIINRRVNQTIGIMFEKV